MLASIRIYSLFLYSLILHNSLGSAQNTTELKELCVYAPGFQFENSTINENCCDYVVKRFNMQWRGRRYLTNYLENIKSWNCSQFYQECSDPTFDFTDFTRTTYKYFCDYEEFQAVCTQDLEDIIGVRISPSNWSASVNLINTTQLSFDELLNPCVQVAVYERETAAKVYNFTEVVNVAIPTCGWIWYGFGTGVVQDRSITPWKLSSNQ